MMLAMPMDHFSGLKLDRNSEYDKLYVDVRDIEETVNAVPR